MKSLFLKNHTAGRVVAVACMAMFMTGCAMIGQSNTSSLPEASLLPGASNDEKVSVSAEEGIRLARMLRDNDRMEGAVAVYARLDQRNELKGAYLLEYATVASTVSSPEAVLKLFSRVRKEAGGDLSAIPADTAVAICNGMGRARLALGQNDEALKEFDCALARDASSLTALNGRAVLLDVAGEHQQAQALWAKARDIDPADINIINNLALSFMAQGKVKETIRMLEPLSIPKSNPALKMNLALAYLLENQKSAAVDTLTSIMSQGLSQRIVEQLSQYSQRIKGSQNASMELLRASRHMLALNEVPE